MQGQHRSLTCRAEIRNTPEERIESVTADARPPSLSRIDLEINALAKLEELGRRQCRRFWSCECLAVQQTSTYTGFCAADFKMIPRGAPGRPLGPNPVCCQAAPPLTRREDGQPHLLTCSDLVVLHCAAGSSSNLFFGQCTDSRLTENGRLRIRVLSR